MEHTILKRPEAKCRRWLRRSYALLAAASAMVLTVNLFLLAHVTEETSTIYQAVNIISDILLIWVLYAVCAVCLIPEHQKYRLLLTSHRSSVTVEGTLLEETGRERAGRFDCVRTVLKTDQGERILYRIDGTLEEWFQAGKALRVVLCGNIAVACEVLE